MSNKLIIACLAYMAASILGQVPSTATEPPPAVVRQVDHIIVHVDTVADAKALWSLFSEKLYLPVAWLPADYKGFFSGGVNVGNVNLEFVYTSEAFGTARNGSPASLLFTSPARKPAKGAISSPTLAFSRAFT